MKPNRLSKILASSGVASRRACEYLIAEGKVRVNGDLITVPQTFVDPMKDKIYVDDKLLKPHEDKICYLLNKPRGYICSNKRIGRKKLVVDIFGEEKRLFTVGRLDRDTTGLLLVTNDGLFAQKVIHPSNNICKEYLVKTQEEITHEHLLALSKGTLIEGKWIRPVKVTKVRRGTLKIAVKEGKKREVRLMVQNGQLNLLSLTRIRIGNLRLGPLEVGEYRTLSKQEQRLIFS